MNARDTTIECKRDTVRNTLREIGDSTPAAPVFVVHPQSQSIPEGEAFTISAIATANPNATYKAQVSTDNGSNWADIPGATNSSYTIASVMPADNGKQYRFVATNSEAPGGVPSNAATLTVTDPLAAPSYTTQPSDQSVSTGNTATITCAVAGNPSPSVIVQRSTDDGANWSQVGAGTSYTTPTLSLANNGDQYRFLATNSQQADVASNVATIAVTDGFDPNTLGPVQYMETIRY